MRREFIFMTSPTPNINQPDVARRNRLILVGIAFALVAFILYRTLSILYPFVVGFVIAYLVIPLVNRLEVRMPAIIKRRKLARVTAIMIVYLTLIILIVATFYIFFSSVIQEVSNLVVAAPVLASRVGEQTNNWVQSQQFADILETYEKNIAENTRQQIMSQIQSIGQRLLETFLNTFQSGAAGVFDVFSKTISVVLGILIIPIWLFYVLNDAPHLTKDMVNIVPLSFRGDVKAVFHIMDTIFDAFLRGQLILCLIVGFAAFAGLAAINVPYFIVLGIFAAIMEAIPMIGPLIGMIPALGIALAQNPTALLMTFILYMIISQVEAIFLKPRVMGTSLSLHPALVMMVLLIGAEMGGIAGMILAAPITAILRDLFKYTYLRLSIENLSAEEALARVANQQLNMDEI